MAELPKGWGDLPREVRDELRGYGLDRVWKGQGGPDVEAMREGIRGTDWEGEVGDDRLTWDTAMTLDAWDVDPGDLGDVVGYRVDYEDGHWYGTMTDSEGDSTRIDFGSDYAAVWDLWDYLDDYYDVDCERGDIDYTEAE